MWSFIRVLDAGLETGGVVTIGSGDVVSIVQAEIIKKTY